MPLEEHVEVGGEPPMTLAEEYAPGGIGGVPVGGLRIEVIGQVEGTERQSDRALRRHLKVSPYTGIQGKEIGKAAGVRHAHVALQLIDLRVGKSVAVLEYGRQTEAVGKRQAMTWSRAASKRLKRPPPGTVTPAAASTDLDLALS